MLTAVPRTGRRPEGAPCGCARRLAAVYRALGVRVLEPRTESEWRSHASDEERKVYPALLEVSGGATDVATSVRRWTEGDHPLYLALLRAGRKLPTGSEPHSVDRHAAEEDALVGRYEESLLSLAAGEDKRTVKTSGTVLPSAGFPPAPPPDGFEIAPNGQPVVLYRPDRSFFSFRMDASGQWWGRAIGSLVRVSTPTDEKGWIDQVTDVVTSYVIPALAGVLGTAVGGPVGPAAALALRTWAQLARGASIGTTLVDQTIAQTKSIVDQSVIRQNYDKIVSQNLPVSEIQKMRSSLPSDEDTRKAFDVATSLAQGKRTQDELVASVRAALPSDRVSGFDAAMRSGGLVRDYVAAVSGNAALSHLETLSNSAASKVQANKVSGGSSSWFWTLSLLAAGGYAAWRFVL